MENAATPPIVQVITTRSVLFRGDRMEVLGSATYVDAGTVVLTDEQRDTLRAWFDVTERLGHASVTETMQAYSRHG